MLLRWKPYMQSLCNIRFIYPCFINWFPGWAINLFLRLYRKVFFETCISLHSDPVLSQPGAVVHIRQGNRGKGSLSSNFPHMFSGEDRGAIIEDDVYRGLQQPNGESPWVLEPVCAAPGPLVPCPHADTSPRARLGQGGRQEPRRRSALMHTQTPHATKTLPRAQREPLPRVFPLIRERISYSLFWCHRALRTGRHPLEFVTGQTLKKKKHRWAVWAAQPQRETQASQRGCGKPCL